MVTKESRMRLYSIDGERLYINGSERLRFYKVAIEAETGKSLLALTVYYTGCRLQEALNLTASDIQAEEGIVAIRSLKKRNQHHVRELPIPKELAQAIVDYGQGKERIWPIGRTTAWRWFKDLMREANIDGKKACAKGLRHSFAIACVMNNIPPFTIQKWMGHASIKTTAIYATVVGPEERLLISRTWHEANQMPLIQNSMEFQEQVIAFIKHRYNIPDGYEKDIVSTFERGVEYIELHFMMLPSVDHEY